MKTFWNWAILLYQQKLLLCKLENRYGSQTETKMSCPESEIQLFCNCLIDYIDAGHTENVTTTQSTDLDRQEPSQVYCLVVNKGKQKAVNLE